jgi:hypothetical protein
MVNFETRRKTHKKQKNAKQLKRKLLSRQWRKSRRHQKRSVNYTDTNSFYSKMCNACCFSYESFETGFTVKDGRETPCLYDDKVDGCHWCYQKGRHFLDHSTDDGHCARCWRYEYDPCDTFYVRKGAMSDCLLGICNNCEKNRCSYDGCNSFICHRDVDTYGDIHCRDCLLRQCICGRIVDKITFNLPDNRTHSCLECSPELEIGG